MSMRANAAAAMHVAQQQQQQQQQGQQQSANGNSMMNVAAAAAGRMSAARVHTDHHLQSSMFSTGIGLQSKFGQSEKRFVFKYITQLQTSRTK